MENKQVISTNQELRIAHRVGGYVQPIVEELNLEGVIF